MPSLEEKIFVDFTAKQIFDLVNDIEAYPEFLPFVQKLEIIEKTSDYRIADMHVGKSFLKRKFRSKVIVDDFNINVSYIDGPFSNLENYWNFQDIVIDKQSEYSAKIMSSRPDFSFPLTGSIIYFKIKFMFKNKLEEKIIKSLFHEIFFKMVNSFYNRAEQIYGKAKIKALPLARNYQD